MSESGFPLPPPTFEFLVFSLKTQAEIRLGMSPFGAPPEGEDNEADLPSARHAIDMLAMIAEKTRGNLSLEEQRLIENSLTELRFRFVQVTESTAKQKAAAAESSAATDGSAAADKSAADKSLETPPGFVSVFPVSVFPKIHITVLGSGTSSGVPTIGCTCEVCQSTDPRDKRLRPSILLRYSGHNVVIDTSPDFRAQVLRAKLERLDAIVYTHAHADHILGLDDIRPFNYRQKSPTPLYGAPETLEAIQRVFRYAFSAEAAAQSSVPKLDLRPLDGTPFEVFGLLFTPVRLCHGKGTVLGFRFGRVAYLTDHSEIPEESKALLGDLDVLFLDALRHRPHPTHTTVEQALQLVEEIKPKRAFFTHMCHDLGHERTEATFPGNVRLAYDGLEIDVNGEPA